MANAKAQQLAPGLEWLDEDDGCTCYVCGHLKALLHVEDAPYPHDWICVACLTSVLTGTKKDATVLCNNCGDSVDVEGGAAYCQDCSVDGQINRCDDCNDDGTVYCESCAADHWEQDDQCVCERCGDDVYWRLCSACYNEHIETARRDGVGCEECGRPADNTFCYRHVPSQVECDDCTQPATHGYCSSHWEQSTQSVSPAVAQPRAATTVTVSEDGNTVTLDDGIVIQF